MENYALVKNEYVDLFIIMENCPYSVNSKKICKTLCEILNFCSKKEMK